MSMEHWRDDTDSGWPKYPEAILYHCSYKSATNSTITVLGSNTALRDDIPTTNHLSHGTVHFYRGTEYHREMSKQILC